MKAQGDPTIPTGGSKHGHPVDYRDCLRGSGSLFHGPPLLPLPAQRAMFVRLRGERRQKKLRRLQWAQAAVIPACCRNFFSLRAQIRAPDNARHDGAERFRGEKQRKKEPEPRRVFTERQDRPGQQLPGPGSKPCAAGAARRRGQSARHLPSGMRPGLWKQAGADGKTARRNSRMTRLKAPGQDQRALPPAGRFLPVAGPVLARSLKTRATAWA